MFQNVHIKAHCFGDETAHCECTSTRGRYGKGLGSAGLLKEAVHLRYLTVKLGDAERRINHPVNLYWSAFKNKMVPKDF